MYPLFWNGFCLPAPLYIRVYPALIKKWATIMQGGIYGQV